MSKRSGKTLRVTLDKHSPITQQTIEDLDTLFSLATPGDLRNTLLSLYFHYTLHIEDCLPIRFKEEAENIHFLQKFLKEADLNHKK